MTRRAFLTAPALGLASAPQRREEPTHVELAKALAYVRAEATRGPSEGKESLWGCCALLVSILEP